MNLDGPREVADVDEERYVRAVAEVEVLVGEAVFELLDVAPRDDGDLLPGLGARWMTERRTGKRDREMEGRTLMERQKMNRRGGQEDKDRVKKSIETLNRSIYI